jgi:DNA-binding CsgD family transcriptional regulator
MSPGSNAVGTEGLTEAFSPGRGSFGDVLLEREAELAELGRLLSRAGSGRGELLLIEGPAGIGKTRLLEEAREAAQRLGFRVLTARGGELEGDLSFGVVRQLLEQAVMRASRRERLRLLEGAARLAEPVLAPPGSAGAGLQTEDRALHGLFWLAANLAEQAPLFLAVDDVHWADAPSMRFLLYLARRLEGLRIAVALTVRTGEVTPQPQLVQALIFHARPPVLRPKPLSPRAVDALVRVGLRAEADAGLAGAVHEATSGNPFLVVELLNQLQATYRDVADIDPETLGRLGSDRIAAAILLRVGRLHPSAPFFARALAVLGAGAPLPVAAELAGIGVSEAARLVSSLVDAAVLGPAPPLRFVHPIVRAAIYEDIPRADRGRMHIQAARLLAETGAASGAVAVHLVAGEPAGDDWAVEELRAAARDAICRGAPEVGVRYLRRALVEPPSPAHHDETLFELGSAAARAGEPDRLELLRTAFARAASQPLRAMAGVELASALLMAGMQTDEMVTVLESALLGLEHTEQAVPLRTMLLLAGLTKPQARDRIRDHLRQARTLVSTAPLEAVRPLLPMVALDLATSDGTATEAAQLVERALAGGQLLRQQLETEAPLGAPAAWVLTQTGRLPAAVRTLDEAVALARAAGSRPALARQSAFRAYCHYRLGALAEAEADARLGLGLSADSGWVIPGCAAAATLVAVYVDRGDLEPAREVLSRIEATDYGAELMPNQSLRESRARLLLAAGEPEAALEELLACGRWERTWQPSTGVVPVSWRSAAAVAHLHLGRRSEARQLAAEELELAERFGEPSKIGIALRALGTAEGGRPGIDLLKQSVSSLAGTDARLEHARALVDLGAELRRSGQPAAAREPLGAAMDLAHRCGATALVSRARAELREAGGRPRRLARTGRESLTPGERRVVDLALQELTNKQIAQALFVTLRTVEMHLSSAYRKLGIRSRDELGDALRQG